MPAKSAKQLKLMQAVANNPKFAKKVNIPQSVGEEYSKESKMYNKKMMNGGKVKKMMKGGKVKKMMGGGMADKAGARAMDPRMAMAMEAQRRQAAMGGMKKGGKVKKMRAGGNTSRENRMEELGRVDAERANTASGRRNLSDEKSRIRSELKMKKGGSVKDKEGRAMAMNKKDMTGAQMSDAAGRAMMKKGGKVKKQGYNDRLNESLGARKGKKSQSMKSRRNESKGAKSSAGKKAYSGNKSSAQGSASRRADGIAQRGRTRGQMR